MNLGINIKKYRTDKSMSQKELADKVGVTQAMINQIEKGVKIPSLGLSLEIAKALNTTVDALADT